jgi:ribosome biogenesis GTPase A
MENTTSTRAEYSTAVMPEIEFVSGEISKLIANPAVCNALGTEFTERMRQWEAAVDKRRTEPFSLVVLGDFKRGKSTVINAILGKNVTPANVAPETFTINSISYGETPSAEAVLKNKQRIPLAQEDLVRERLEHLSKAFPDEIDYIDIRDSADILKEIRIVDTPGLSDLDRLDKQVQDYLVNADAVVYIASALSPMSESEQNFLAAYVRPLAFGKFFVLVNMIDAMNTMEDIQKVIGRITEKCQAIIPNCYVYGVSGIDEYRRKIGLNRPDIKGFQEFYENEFLKFELALNREVILQKDTIKNQRVIAMMKIMTGNFLSRINMIQGMSEMGQKQLDEISSMLENECAELKEALDIQKPNLHLWITEMLQTAEQWIYGFFAKFRGDIVAARTSCSADEIDKYFYPFLVDKVGEAYRRCIEIHKTAVNMANKKIGDQLSRKLGIADIAEKAAKETVSRDITKEMGSLVTGTIMSATGNDNEFPGSTVSSFRLLLKRKGKTDSIDTVLENYDDIRNNIVKDLKKAYEKMEEAAIGNLDDIYHAQSEAGKEALRQAKLSVTEQSPTQKRALQSAEQILRSAELVLNKYA